MALHECDIYSYVQDMDDDALSVGKMCASLAIHYSLSYHRFHCSFETFYLRLLSRWAALLEPPWLLMPTEFISEMARFMPFQALVVRRK